MSEGYVSPLGLSPGVEVSVLSFASGFRTMLCSLPFFVFAGTFLASPLKGHNSFDRALAERFQVCSFPCSFTHTHTHTLSRRLPQKWTHTNINTSMYAHQHTLVTCSGYWLPFVLTKSVLLGAFSDIMGGQLFAHVVHVHTPKMTSGMEFEQDIDFIVVRENTEGEYRGLEHEVQEGVVENIKVVTEEASERIAQFALDMATRLKLSRVISVHKANIMSACLPCFLQSSDTLAMIVRQACLFFCFYRLHLHGCCICVIMRRVLASLGVSSTLWPGWGERVSLCHIAFRCDDPAGVAP